jgi:hypothetical protein
MELNPDSNLSLKINSVTDKTTNKNIYPELKRFGHTLTLSKRIINLT